MKVALDPGFLGYRNDIRAVTNQLKSSEEQAEALAGKLAKCNKHYYKPSDSLVETGRPTEGREGGRTKMQGVFPLPECPTPNCNWMSRD
jgi:hypothetical protein